jgi:hypothetical protein
MLKYVFTKFIILSWVISSAQVHVRDEPRHHNVFENEYIRILDVYLGPKDTTQYHLHNTPSVFIILADCKVSSQLLGGQPQPGANVSGTISYDPINTARTHRVWNEDTVWFHVMDIELISKTSKTNINEIVAPSLKLLFNERQVNGYEADLKPKDHLQLPPAESGYLLVSKTDASIDYSTNKTKQQRSMKAGHYLWIGPGVEFSITSKENKTTSFVILQLK